MKPDNSKQSVDELAREYLITIESRHDRDCRENHGCCFAGETIEDAYLAGHAKAMEQVEELQNEIEAFRRNTLDLHEYFSKIPTLLQALERAKEKLEHQDDRPCIKCEIIRTLDNFLQKGGDRG